MRQRRFWNHWYHYFYFNEYNLRYFALFFFLPLSWFTFLTEITQNLLLLLACVKWLKLHGFSKFLENITSSYLKIYFIHRGKVNYFLFKFFFCHLKGKIPKSLWFVARRGKFIWIFKCGIIAKQICISSCLEAVRLLNKQKKHTLQRSLRMQTQVALEHLLLIVFDVFVTQSKVKEELFVKFMLNWNSQLFSLSESKIRNWDSRKMQ